MRSTGNTPGHDVIFSPQDDYQLQERFKVPPVDLLLPEPIPFAPYGRPLHVVHDSQEIALLKIGVDLSLKSQQAGEEAFAYQECAEPFCFTSHEDLSPSEDNAMLGMSTFDKRSSRLSTRSTISDIISTSREMIPDCLQSSFPFRELLSYDGDRSTNVRHLSVFQGHKITVNGRRESQATLVSLSENDFDELSHEEAFESSFLEVKAESPKSNGAEHLWMLRYNELVEFFKRHGHSNVPSMYTQNVALGFWVKRTRHGYKRYALGQPSSLTKGRVELLKKVDFQWGRQDISWNAQFRRVKEFKQEHGHIRIPQSKRYMSLFNWLKRQRKLIRKQQKAGNQKLFISRERCQQLRALGIA